MKILHVLIPATTGGMERVVQALTVGHHRRGHDVTVLAMRFGGPETYPFVEFLDAAGVRVEARQLGARAYLRERRIVANLCRRIRPDVVHTHGYRTDVVDRPVAARMGIPTVTTAHGRDMRAGTKGRVYEWLQRRNYRRFDAVVTVSRPLEREAMEDGVPRERVHYIPNAYIDLDEPMPRLAARRLLTLEDSDRVVGWVGRLLPVKGPDLLLEALSRLPRPRPIAAMIGGGPEAENLRQRAEALGVSERVRFYGEIEDAGRLFGAFDTYVLSSRSEGLPIVLFEAIAAGTPIVATGVGGVPDVIDGDGGWMVPAGDTSALAEAIAESLRDREEALRRSELARRRVATEFALDPWLDQYEDVYRHVVAQHGD